MKGYSKIKSFRSPSSKKSFRSPSSQTMALSDLLTSLEHPKKTRSTATIPRDTHLETEKPKNNDAKTNSSSSSNNKNKKKDSFLELQEDQEGYNNNEDQMFGAKLKRNSSLSSSSAAALHSAVKKAFSMKRSSSVTERYSRIHDQSIPLTHDDDDDDNNDDTVVDAADHVDGDSKAPPRSIKQKNSKGRLIKACKKLFGR